MGDAGVQVVLEGDMARIEDFISSLGRERPPMSRIDEVQVRWMPASREFDRFEVVESERGGSGLQSVVPPDMAICGECLKEMFDINDRRYLYPFITCVNCGPRFTIIEDLPYDRQRTSMEEFRLCADCAREYTDPADRRYHAEPTCCARCGPRLGLYGSRGDQVKTGDAPRDAMKLLDEGNIIAIKGIGGTHIAAKTTSDEVLKRLRERFHRPQQPFAVMSKDLDAARTFAKFGPDEEQLLVSPPRPIVTLKRADDFPLSELVAPGLDSVGVMLPYSGIHHVLLHHGKEPAYVMTSANLPGLPMAIDNQDALKSLSDLVDYFLFHNRRIVSRCDDSVVRFTAGAPVFLRRSRGYVPAPIKLGIKGDSKVLALGAELCVTVSLLKDNRCYPSQHIGDVTKLETLEYLRKATDHLMHLLNFKRIDAVACDLHPAYETTTEAEAMAERFGAKLIKVQHHHAHLTSLMAEQGLEEIVGIAADGVGYGSDGSIWGGEVMVVSPTGFERVGGLAKQPMPGGDLATRFPARMVAGILSGALPRDEVSQVLKEFCISAFPKGESEIEAVMRQLERGVNVSQTSSCGRVLDAVSCLLGICAERTYEGEPAMKLEAAAANGNSEEVRLRMEVKKGDPLAADSAQLLLDVLSALRSGVHKKDIAAGAQRAIAAALADMAVESAKERGIGTVGVSGGIFCNDVITRCVRDAVVRGGLKFRSHRLVPPGDGGISVGQAFVAASQLKER